MLNEQTLGTLNALKLFGMAKSFNDKLAHPQAADLSHPEFFALIVQDEKTYRENLRLKRLLSNAKLKQQAALEDIDYKHPRGLNKQAILELSSQDWIAHHRNVLLTGPTGVGKSYIACALGNFAARQGLSVLYLRAPRLFETLLQSKADGSHLKTLTRLAKVQLLILDDLFLTPLNDAERKDLLEIIEDRHQKAPTVITSQCPTKDWHHIIGEPTIADAVCDRLLHHCYKIELKGESIRKTKK
ncbi:MAG: IS21-like element helper ATPase IstB [Pseudolabrys sp.]|jgi:DNA replication protein DnaC